jgi:hypothetical protein
MYSQKPEMAKKWEAVTPKGKLPEYKKKAGKKKAAHEGIVKGLTD